jgi:hypothetical protein
MGAQNQTFRSSSSLSTSNNILNVVAPATANQEFSQAITNGTKQLMIRCRGSANLKMTFVSGETSTKSLTIYKGTVYSAKDLNLQSKTVYLMSDKPSEVIEIEEWF